MFRWSVLFLGLAAGGLGCLGAAEQQYQMEGGINYLVIAGVVRGIAALIIPYFVERTWRDGHRFKSVVWFVIWIPVAASVFLSQVDRFHRGQAGVDAERAAAHAAVTRAEEALRTAEAKATTAEADTKEARKAGSKKCDANCVKKWDDATTAAGKRADEARNEVTKLQAKATEANTLAPPVTLSPLALDLIALAAIWTALALTKSEPAPVKRRRKRRKTKARPPKAPLIHKIDKPFLRVVSGR